MCNCTLEGRLGKLPLSWSLYPGGLPSLRQVFIDSGIGSWSAGLSLSTTSTIIGGTGVVYHSSNAHFGASLAWVVMVGYLSSHRHSNRLSDTQMIRLSYSSLLL